jgi:processive 1,2-diacylglycerol beta-glucosyltransferase
MANKTILLLSVSAGAGHVRAADALHATALEQGMVAEAIHLDVMDFVGSAFRALYTDFYIKLVNKAPTLWGYLYNASNNADPDSTTQRMRRALERLNTGALLREIDKIKPDAIVCTHFLPAELLSRAIGKQAISCPVWVQVTDFDLHSMWVQAHMAGYFAANEEVAFRMRASGIDADRIHVTGIPIMPAFSRKADREACAAALGIDPARTTILLMGGGAGLGSLETVAERLLEIKSDFQLIALAGNNTRALDALQALAQRYPGRLLPQGFTREVERLMACADLAITKPGGLTSSECLAMGLPMIVNSPIPGQEERNADFLLEQGVALKAVDAVTLEYRVGQLIADPQRLEQMRGKARALGRPGAAAAVLHQVLAVAEGA